MDLGGGLPSDGDETRRPAAAGRIEDPSERGWATEWIGAILAREKVEITPEVKDSSVVGTDISLRRRGRSGTPTALLSLLHRTL